jgi:transcriptional regulator with XRE-family HTH domain
MTDAPADLRERRLAKGWSMGEVCRRTRIPEAHLAALEEGRDHELPPGPYAAGYRRTLEELYGSPAPQAPGPPQVEAHDAAEAPPTSTATSPRPTVPLGALRIFAGAAAVGLVLAMAWQMSSTLAAREAVVVVVPADQKLRVKMRRSGRVRVEVDGAQVLDRVVPGGEELVFEASDEIAVELQTMASAQLWFNGDRVRPQGRQDTARRLVFRDSDAP